MSGVRTGMILVPPGMEPKVSMMVAISPRPNQTPGWFMGMTLVRFPSVQRVTVAESVDPTGEADYWRGAYASRPYYKSQYDYDTDYAPAYAYGNTVRSQYAGRTWDDSLEADIKQGWEATKAKSRLTWEQAKDAVRDALHEAGITEIRVWAELSEPEFCEDCGAPLYPNPKGEVAHTETPDEGEPQTGGGHFH